MNRKNLVLCLLLVLVLAIGTGCSDKGGSGDDQSQDQTSDVEVVTDDQDDIEDLDEEYSDISYNEENEDGEIEKVKTDVSKFFGKWTADSGKSEYLYGNVDIVVNSDGTWIGNISDEKLGGRWTDQGDSLWMEDDNDIFSFSLAFSKTGKLILIEKAGEVDETDGDYLNTVLTKVE